jgi:hypothetical protein
MVSPGRPPRRARDNFGDGPGRFLSELEDSNQEHLTATWTNGLWTPEGLGEGRPVLRVGPKRLPS